MQDWANQFDSSFAVVCTLNASVSFCFPERSVEAWSVAKKSWAAAVVCVDWIVSPCFFADDAFDFDSELDLAGLHVSVSVWCGVCHCRSVMC